MIRMRKKPRLSLIGLILLSSLLTVISVSPVRGEASVTLQVTRAVWGPNTNTPQEAYPGDANVPLTIETQNYSNDTIKGVKATLMLKRPFTDTYGNYNVTATGTPTVAGNVLNQTGEILAGGFFTLTYNINIASNATLGTYQENMSVSYLVKSGSVFVKGTPKILGVSLVVSKAPSTITCSSSPQRIEKGESVDTTGSINPAHENVTVTLLYKKPNGLALNRTVRTAADSSYRDSYQPDVEGTWNVNASWVGDAGHKGSWASASFEVMFPVTLNVLTSSTRLIGGVDNTFNLTLLNKGDVSLSSIDITFTIPSPLVLRGDNYWTFKYLEPKNSAVILTGIYPPSSAIGATYQSQLQLSYRDYYGQSHSDTYPLGLIIVGRIEPVVYGKTVSPQSSSPGSGVSFTATVLNKGNVKAMYANASILPSSVLELSDESTTYIGDIEENSPVPFTVLAKVSSNAEEGVYPIKIVLFYRDDQYRDHSLSLTLSLTVAKTQTGQNSSSSSWNPLTFLREVWWTIIVLIGASVTILILYRRRYSRRVQVSHPMSG